MAHRKKEITRNGDDDFLVSPSMRRLLFLDSRNRKEIAPLFVYLFSVFREIN